MIKKILIFKSDNIYIQLFRYFFVGGFAFIIDFSVFLFFVEYVQVHYLIANVIAFLAGLLTNYLLSLWWVFNNRKIKVKSKELFIFIIIGVIGLFLSQFLLYIFIDILHSVITYAKIYTTLITFAWNFVARKIILF